MSEQDRVSDNLAAVATAAAHGERLAVLETHVSAIQADVVEIKGDVKTLLGHQAGRDGATAVFARIVPWIALLVSIAVAFRAS